MPNVIISIKHKNYGINITFKFTFTTDAPV